jgi:hypothetical protein
MDNKELEKLFREQLGDHGETPDPRVWDRIRSSLDAKKSKKVIPLWWGWGAAAAVVIGVLFLASLWRQPESSLPSITGSEMQDETQIPENTQTPDLEDAIERPNPAAGLAEQDIEKSYSPDGDRDGENPGSSDSLREAGRSRLNSPGTGSIAKETYQNTARKKEQHQKLIHLHTSSEVAVSDINPDEPNPNSKGGVLPAKLKNEQSVEAIVVQAGEQSTSKDGAGASEISKEGPQEAPDMDLSEDDKKSIFEVIETQEALAEKTEDAGGRWLIGPSLAPVYFDSFGNGSPIDQDFVNNSKSGAVNMSYGLQVAYKVSKRLSIRSGIHRVEYGYNTEEVGFTSSPAALPSSLIRTISYSENSRSLVVHSTASGAQEPQAPVAADINAPSAARIGQMVQEFGYLEVPVEMQYSLIDKKWGLNLIGGMSSLFLMNNSVSLESAGTVTEVGESNNMNSLNFSTNVGLGVFYRLNQRLELNLQPMFKYQLNTFTQTEGSFRPYSVGVYSGLCFRF